MGASEQPTAPYPAAGMGRISCESIASYPAALNPDFETINVLRESP